MPYDPMNQVHPGPQEGIDRIPADTTQARTGNTEREQETWFAGIEEGQRRAEHNAAVRSAWMLIDSAPKDGTEIWAYNGEQARMRWIEGECYALWIWADELLSDADPNPDQPTHWQPLPAAPCQTCNDLGAVGNILTAEPCPDCSPASVAPGDAQKVYHFEQRSRFGPWIEVEKPTAKSVEFVKRSDAPVAGDARDLLPPLDDDLSDILGQPNFRCANLAEQLRAGGHEIQRKAEQEQAAVIHFLLGHYLKHGSDWRETAGAALDAIAA
ncbi:DUF551 domain-containing protein, partial [Bordetella bronchiseptica]